MFNFIGGSFSLIVIERLVKMKTEQCTICVSEHPQVRIMLAHLRRQLLRQNQEYVPNYQQVDDPKDSPDGFNRLLTLILGKHYTSHPSFTNCQHQKFSRYFRRKLKCDNLTFNLLCAQIASKVAQKNYQLEILNIQITSIANTALEEAGNPLAPAVVEQLSRQKEERAKKSKTSRQIETEARIPSSEQIPYERIPPYWMGPPPLMHFPWMFPHPRHESN